jgi:hypothetical protein
MAEKLVTPDGGPGCYVEGSWGQYGTGRMIQIAVDLGYEVPPDDKPYFEAELKATQYGREANESADQQEIILSLADLAEKWLNDNAPEGFAWGWEDGEFFFQSLTWWQEQA